MACFRVSDKEDVSSPCRQLGLAFNKSFVIGETLALNVLFLSVKIVNIVVTVSDGEKGRVVCYLSHIDYLMLSFNGCVDSMKSGGR
uniref:Uncharacterized protein n=1 Tax=Salix viminalis TaxID=40686 RepID=A0A6N2KZ33_SALVM